MFSVTTKIIFTTEEVIRATLKVVLFIHYKSDIGHCRRDHSNFKSYLNHYISDLSHWRSDHILLENYLNHYRSDVSH